MKVIRMLMIVVSFLVTGLCFGQGSESFTNLPLNSPTTSYANFSYVGNNGLNWTSVAGRTDQVLMGKAFCGQGGTPRSSITSAQFPNGVGTLQFDYVRGFTNSESRSLRVFVNGTQIGVTIAVSKTSDIPAHYSQPINISGNTIISIEFSGHQTIIDNIQWTAYSSTPQSEINLSGNSNNIISGETSTSFLNNTNFGSAEVGVGSQIHTFTIENTGTADLNLTAAAPYILISGANASDFSVTSTASTPIATSTQSPFQITFSPQALGVRNALVTIANNDADENPYTFAISGAGTYSNLSRIVDVTDFSTASPQFNISPEYINFINPSSTTIGKFIPMKLRLFDGPDSDALPTILTELRLSVTDMSAASQILMIKTAILTTSGGTLISTATKVAGELVFSGMSGANVTANDEGQQNIHLRISIDENQVIDQTKLIFSVTSASSSPGGSAFAFPNAGGAQSDIVSNNRNRLNVTATKLMYNTQPQTTAINAAMPAVILEAVDQYNRRDVNFSSLASVTSTGTMNGSPLSASFNLGLATFSSIVHSAAGTGLTLNATSSSFMPLVSLPFNITAINYTVGDYKSSSSGLWKTTAGGGIATWQRYDGTNWVANMTPPLNTSNNVYISSGHTVTSPATFPFTGAKLKIMGAAVFLVKSSGSFTGSIYIYDGGKLRTDLAFRNNGMFEVENNGTVEINYNVDFNSTIWNGTEIFHPNSNLVLFEVSTTAPFYNGVRVASNTFNSYDAGFGNIVIDMPSTSISGDVVLLEASTNKNLAHGNLIFRNLSNSTAGGIRKVKLADGASNVISGIGGNFIVESGFFNAINFKTGGNLDFTIRGNMSLSNGFSRIYAGNSGNSVINIEGELFMTGSALLELRAGNSTIGLTTFNLKGNLTCISNANIKNSTSLENSYFNFNGSALQQINVVTNAAASNSNIIFNAEFGSNLQLINQDLRLGSNSTFNVLDGATLDFGFNGTTSLNISRAGTAGGTKFFSALGSTLKITSPNGINNTSNSLGNVQTTNAPTYNSLATFWYIGKENQITGTGLPSTASGKQVYVNMEQDNLSLTVTSDVNITNSTALDPSGGKLEIQKGKVFGSNNKDFHGTGRLKMSGGEYHVSSFFTSNPETTYLPKLSNYGNYDLTGGLIDFSAINQTQVISGTPTYYSLKFSGSNNLGLNFKGISSATSVTNSIIIAENAIVDVKLRSLGVTPASPAFTMTENSRFITAGTGVKPDATGEYSLGPNTTIEYNNNSAATLQKVRLINSIPLYANIVISGSNVGTDALGDALNSNIKFQPLGTFTVTPTGTFKLSNSYGFSGGSNTAISNTNNPTITLNPLSTIEYAGASQIVSPFLLSSYANLTISGSGQKTLGNPSNIFVNEKLTVLAGNLLVNTNEVITVRESVITTAGTLQVENNGQLIQISEVDSNVGTGVNYKRTAQVKNSDFVYWSSPVADFTTLSLPGNSHYQWSTLLLNLNETLGNWEIPSSTMTLGRGYIAKASNGATTPQPLTGIFTGKPNNGVITIPVLRGDYDGVPYDAEPSNPNNLPTTKDDDNWNLIGNPYPSAIDAEKFLVENVSVVAGAVYIWTHATLPTSTQDPYYADFAYNYNASDYTIYNKLGTSTPNTFNGKIAAAQGFMVNMLDAAASGTSVVFKNAMRYDNAFAPYDNTNFYRSQNAISTEDKSRIWLDLINTTTSEIGSILVGYAEEATMDKDHFYDCGFESRGDHSFYSLINTESFVIQGRALPFNYDDIVPLGFTLNHLGDLAISIKDVDGIFSEDTPIILEDKDLNVFHDLKTAPYFFNSLTGVFNNRFQLRYGTELSTSHPNNTPSKMQILGKNGIVYLKSSTDSIVEVSIYDVLGRLLLQSDNQNSLYLEIPFNLISKQPIIVKAKLENGQIVSQKIIF